MSYILNYKPKYQKIKAIYLPHSKVMIHLMLYFQLTFLLQNRLRFKHVFTSLPGSGMFRFFISKYFSIRTLKQKKLKKIREIKNLYEGKHSKIRINRHL